MLAFACYSAHCSLRWHDVICFRWHTPDVQQCMEPVLQKLKRLPRHICLDHLPGLKVSALWCTSRNVYIFTGVFQKETELKKKKKGGGRCKYARNIQHERAILGPEQKAERCNVVMAHHAILEELQSAVRIWRTSFRASTLWSSQQSTGWGGAAMSHTDAAFSGFFLSGSWRTNIHTDKSTVLCVAGLKSFTFRIQNPFEFQNLCTYVI